MIEAVGSGFWLTAFWKGLYEGTVVFLCIEKIEWSWFFSF
jgi:hypothetical protein